MAMAQKPRLSLLRLSAVAVCAAAMPSPAQASETIEYTYDARGRLVAVKRIQPSGTIETKYEYDRADNRTKKEVTP